MLIYITFRIWSWTGFSSWILVMNRISSWILVMNRNMPVVEQDFQGYMPLVMTKIFKVICPLKNFIMNRIFKVICPLLWLRFSRSCLFWNFWSWKSCSWLEAYVMTKGQYNLENHALSWQGANITLKIMPWKFWLWTGFSKLQGYIPLVMTNIFKVIFQGYIPRLYSPCHDEGYIPRLYSKVIFLLWRRFSRLYARSGFQGYNCLIKIFNNQAIFYI